MYEFVFSHDAHVSEPVGLIDENLPKAFWDSRLHSVRKEDYVATMAGDRRLHHLKLGRAGADISRASEAAEADRRVGKNPGGHNIGFRLEEMARSAVDSSVAFPGIIGFAYALDPEPGLAHMKIWNDWSLDHFKALPNTFVPTAMIPADSPQSACRELERVLKLGFRAVMMPMEAHPTAPNYVDPTWDPVWSMAEEAGVPVTMHSGSSRLPIRYHGPGAACMNHFAHGLDAQHTIAHLVVSGVLDRHPKLKVVNCESGADWMLWMGEHMDEVYITHGAYVSPKLTRLPSEILYAQVIATTHRERGCIETRDRTGLRCFIWSDDYPHAEGTYPNTRSILSGLFDGVDISQTEKDLIVGGTAAELYKLNPAAAKAEKTRFAAA